MLLSQVPFIPELFFGYQQETVATKSRLVTSGIMSTDTAIQTEFQKGGRLIDLPFFGDLSGASQVLSDITGLTAQTIGGGVQTAVRIMRGQSWKSSDLAAELAGDDPMEAIARSTGRYWTREMQTILINVIRGLFDSGGPLATTHVSGGASTIISSGAFIDGFAKLGDEGESLTGIIVHSAIYYALLKADLLVPTSYTTSQLDSRVSQQNLEVMNFLGRPILVDDTMTKVPNGGNSGTDTLYKSYLFGPGAFRYAMAPAKTPIETDRDSAKGIDYLFNRVHMLIHPNGMKWVGNAAGSSPTDAELATPTNWTKEFTEDKNIKIVEVQTYID